MQEINLELYVKVSELETTLNEMKLFIIVFTKYFQELDTLDTPDFWKFVETNYFSHGSDFKAKLLKLYDSMVMESNDYLNKSVLEDL